MRPYLWLSAALLLMGPEIARAKKTPLERAEAAYLAIDFQKTHDFAIKALRNGGNRGKTLTRVFELLGVA